MSTPAPADKAYRFNPPPSWPPPPPGWTPPQGWAPPPSWPPPPHGWQFWVETLPTISALQDTGAAGLAGPAPDQPGVAASRSRAMLRWAIIGGTVVVGLVIANVTGGILGHVFALIVWATAACLCIRPAKARTASAARMWARIGAAVCACLAIYAGSLAIVGMSSGSQNWYADGKAFVLRDNKVDTANLVGPPGIVQTWCTNIVNSGTAAVPTGPLPPTADSSAVTQWVSGCMEGYAESHPNDPDGSAGP